MCDCVTSIACALRWEVAHVGEISTGLCLPRRGISPFQVHERTTLLRGHEYEEGRVVTLNTMFVKYIGTICFDIIWFVKELYIKHLYNNMGSCMFARKI